MKSKLEKHNNCIPELKRSQQLTIKQSTYCEDDTLAILVYAEQAHTIKFFHVPTP